MDRLQLLHCGDNAVAAAVDGVPVTAIATVTADPSPVSSPGGTQQDAPSSAIHDSYTAQHRLRSTSPYSSDTDSETSLLRHSSALLRAHARVVACGISQSQEHRDRDRSDAAAATPAGGAAAAAAAGQAEDADAALAGVTRHIASLQLKLAGKIESIHGIRRDSARSASSTGRKVRESEVKYEFVRKLGSGKYGTVYLARAVHAPRAVAAAAGAAPAVATRTDQRSAAAAIATPGVSVTGEDSDLVAMKVCDFVAMDGMAAAATAAGAAAGAIGGDAAGAQCDATTAAEAARLEVEKEARVLSMLCPHPHIIGYRSHFHSTGRLHIAMEYATHGSLADVLAPLFGRGRLIQDALRYFGWQWLQSIAHIHSKGIVHRDLWHGNLLVCEGHRLCAADFGYCLELDSTYNGSSGDANSNGSGGASSGGGDGGGGSVGVEPTARATSEHDEEEGDGGASSASDIDDADDWLDAGSQSASSSSSSSSSSGGEDDHDDDDGEDSDADRHTRSTPTSTPLPHHPHKTVTLAPVEGCWCYHAPELARGEPQGYPADLWTFGATLYVWLTGYPLTADYQDVTSLLDGSWTLTSSPGYKQFKELPSDFKRVIRSCLRWDPWARPTAADLLGLRFVASSWRAVDIGLVMAECSRQIAAEKAAAEAAGDGGIAHGASVVVS